MKFQIKKLKNQYGVTLVEVLIVMGIMGALAVVMMNMTKQQNVMQKKAESTFEVSTLHSSIVSNLLTAQACRNSLAPAGNITTATQITQIRNRVNAVIFNTTTNYNNLVQISRMQLVNRTLSAHAAGKAYGEITLRMTYTKTASILPGEAKNTTFDIPLKIEVNAANVVTNCYSAVENAIDEAKLQSCVALNGVFDTAIQRCNLTDYPGVGAPVGNDNTAVSTQYLLNFLSNYLDLRYVNVTGDAMTGPLEMNSSAAITMNGSRLTNNNGGITVNSASNFISSGSTTITNSPVTMNASSLSMINANLVQTGSGYISTAQYVSVSDKRLKTDFKSLEGISDKIYDVKSYEFVWKENGRKDFGFIAQEIEELFPQLVTTNKDGLKGVQYVSMVPLIIEEMKKLKKENEQLKFENEELRRDIELIKMHLRIED